MYFGLFIFQFKIVMVKPMKQKGHVPELTPSVQDGSEVRVSLIRNQGKKLSKKVLRISKYSLLKHPTLFS